MVDNSPRSTSIEGLMVSIRWYLGDLKGTRGGAGSSPTLRLNVHGGMLCFTCEAPHIPSQKDQNIQLAERPVITAYSG